MKEGDAVSVVEAINANLVVADWLNKLTLTNAEALKLVCVKYDKSGHSDTVIRAYSKFVPTILELEVIFI